MDYEHLLWNQPLVDMIIRVSSLNSVNSLFSITMNFETKFNVVERICNMKQFVHKLYNSIA